MNYRPALLILAIISFLAACTKIETTDIGSDLIPPVDNINTFDITVDVLAENAMDTFPAYPVPTDDLVLGRINNDPLFGRTTGIINLELLPPARKFYFRGLKDSLVLDSMVLVLNYRGIWGDSSSISARTQTLRVYEISQSNKLTDTVLNSTRTVFAHQATQLGTVVVDPKALIGTGSKPDTMGPNNEVVRGNQIRIRITDPSIQNRFFNLYDSSDNSPNNAYLNDSAFRTKFAGFAVVPDTNLSSPNSLYLINIADTNTKFAIYYSYRDTARPRRDTTVDYFRFSYPGKTGGFSNNIIRNYIPGTEFLNYVAAGTDSLIYLQTRPGGAGPGAPYAKIRIPALDTMSNRIIHRAELIVQQVADPLSTVFTPPFLFLSAFSTDSSRKFMLPGSDISFNLQGVQNFNAFGGYPFSRTDAAGTAINYNFNISRYVQGIVTNKNRNYTLALWAPFDDYILVSESFNTVVPISGSGVVNPLALGRVRVGGTYNDPNAPRRMRLRIIYTRL